MELIGLWILVGWAAVYGGVILLAIAAKRSWTDLLAVFGILLMVGCLLNFAHPLLGSGLLTILPVVGLVVGLMRRSL
jgi:hypothetical protein